MGLETDKRRSKIEKQEVDLATGLPTKDETVKTTGTS